MNCSKDRELTWDKESIFCFFEFVKLVTDLWPGMLFPNSLVIWATNTRFFLMDKLGQKMHNFRKEESNNR